MDSNWSRSKPLHVGFVGEILADIIATPRLGGSSVDKGINVEARLGGAPINASVVASQFGDDVRSYPICAVGNDWIAAYLIQELSRFPIQMDLITQSTLHTTSAAFYPLSLSGEQLWSEFHRDADLVLCNPSSLHVQLRRLNALGFGAPTLANGGTAGILRQILEHVSGECVLAIDVNYRSAMWQGPVAYVSALEEWLPHVDVIKSNEVEAMIITGETNPLMMLDRFPMRDDQVLCLTLGSKGCYVQRGNERQFVGTQAVVGSPIGAGDAYFGALVVALAQFGRGACIESLEKAARFCNHCGAIANSHSGACSAAVTPDYQRAFSYFNKALEPPVSQPATGNDNGPFR